MPHAHALIVYFSKPTVTNTQTYILGKTKTVYLRSRQKSLLVLRTDVLPTKLNDILLVS